MVNKHKGERPGAGKNSSLTAQQERLACCRPRTKIKMPQCVLVLKATIKLFLLLLAMYLFYVKITVAEREQMREMTYCIC